MLKKREAAMGLLSPSTAALQASIATQPNSMTSQANLKPNPQTSAQPLPTAPHAMPNFSNPASHLHSPSSGAASTAEAHYGSSTSNLAPTPTQTGGVVGGSRGFELQQASSSGAGQATGEAALLDISILADRGKAFEVFRWVNGLNSEQNSGSADQQWC